MHGEGVVVVTGFTDCSLRLQGVGQGAFVAVTTLQVVRCTVT